MSNNTINHCFICFDTDLCKGIPIRSCSCSSAYVHRECLDKWIKTSNKDHCIVCKYQYKYKLEYNPSLDRCLECNNSCYPNFTNNENTLIVIMLSFMLPFLFLFVISLTFGIQYISLLCWICFSIQLLILFFLKQKDKTLNYFISIKYLQFVNSLIFYFYFSIMLIINDHSCQIDCINETYSCNKDCSYFIKHIEIRYSYINGILHQSIILSSIVIVILLNQLKRILYYPSIQEVKI